MKAVNYKIGNSAPLTIRVLAAILSPICFVIVLVAKCFGADVTIVFNPAPNKE